ncbi:MAG: hypothetical protein EOP88_24205 [Verrucomicrobiaceae bacterium]|nr:MAG: hypothetical protein EOP88_24205 [Verrucomicrobiaceae bacterium]
MKSSNRSLFSARPLQNIVTFTGLFLSAAALKAADIQWDGGAVDGGLLNTGANWAGDVFPGNGNRGVIGNGETAAVNGTTGNVSIGSLRVVNGSFEQTGQTLTMALANGAGVTTEFMVGTSGSGSASATFTNATVARTGDNFGFLIGDANGATVLNRNTPVASSGSVTLNSSTVNTQAITIVGKSNTAGTAAGTGSLTLNGTSVLNQTSPGALNRTFIVGENLNSSGTVTLNDTSQLNVGYRMYIGSNAGGNGSMSIAAGAKSISGNDTVIGNNGGTGLVNNAGELRNTGGWMLVGTAGASNGTLNTSGSAVVASAGNLVIGSGGTAQGTFKASASSVTTVGGELWVGNDAAGAKGFMTVENNASVTVNSWMAVGRNQASGTLTQTGGTITKNSTTNTHFVIGSYGNNAKGTYNQSGGTLNVNGVSSVYIGEGGTPGVGNTATITADWNMSGGVANINNLVIARGNTGGVVTGTINVSGGAELKATSVTMAQFGGAVGTLNLDGGTFQSTGISKGLGTAKINFNGGTMRAGGASAGFFGNLASSDLDIKAGGLNFDTNTFEVTVTQDLSGAGGLTKSGGGTLTLGGATTYSGATVVSAGTLLVSGTLGSGNVTIASGATLDTGTATIGSAHSIGGGGTLDADLVFAAGSSFVLGQTLNVTGTVTFTDFDVFDVVGLNSSTANGTYTLIDGASGYGGFAGVSNFGLENAADLGDGKSAYFQEGSFQLVVIPEPTAALLGCAGSLLLLRRRRN